MSFQSAWSTNAVSICRSCGLEAVTRVEVSRRFLLTSSAPVSPEVAGKFAAMVKPLQIPSYPLAEVIAVQPMHVMPPVCQDVHGSCLTSLGIS